MADQPDRADVLARLTGNPLLARAVPHLPPEVLQAVIAHYGLQECGELLALATPEQLAAVLDLDLFTPDRAGADEQFDPARFGEWLAVLVDTSAELAAERLASMDAPLVVAGLAANVAVFDLAVFSPRGEPTGADPVPNAGRQRGAHVEIGGYIVVARRSDAWDAIVEVLLALDERHTAAFHRIMAGCRTLSSSGWEIDGLHQLSGDQEQALFDLSVSREARRERTGFLPPPQARAFLEAARRVSFEAPPPAGHVLFTAYRRSLSVTDEPGPDRPHGDPDARVSIASDPGAPAPATDDEIGTQAVAGVIEILRGAGVLADAPRALLPGAQDPSSLRHAALDDYLRLRAADDDALEARHQELAFLANALVAGCSVQGRSFTRREAMDAATATCNLGLAYWPPRWPPAAHHDLVTVFQAGWAVLHHDVAMASAAALSDALDHVRTSDRDLQLGLHALRRDLQAQRQAGTPWRGAGRLEVLASLDLLAWAALTALLGECPAMLANIGAPGGLRPHRVDPSDVRFVSDPADIAAVHGFLRSLPDLLTR